MLPPDLITSNIQLEQFANGLGIENFSVDCDMNQMLDIKEGEYHIVNISTIQGAVGHWTLACRVDGERYYFDSFGVTAPRQVVRALGGEYKGADLQKQKISASDCGVRALYVAYLLSLGCRFIDILIEMKL